MNGVTKKMYYNLCSAHSANASDFIETTFEFELYTAMVTISSEIEWVSILNNL